MGTGSSSGPGAAGGIEAELARLFGFVERDVHVGDSDPPVPGITVGVRPGELFTLRGDGYQALRDVVDSIAQPAERGGPSVEEAESLLLTACSRFLDEGAQEAIAWLTATLRAPVRTWTVIRPTTTFQMADRVTIGACRFQRGLPEVPFDPDVHVTDAFPAFSIAVDVQPVTTTQRITSPRCDSPRPSP